MNRHRTTSPRLEYREQEARRTQAAPSLSEKFRQLKSLIVGLQYYDNGGTTKGSQIKYTVNIANAKAVLRFSCPNNECVRGDFDLTKPLADAVAKHRTSATGELSCRGWRSKTTIDTVHCHNVLRYTLSLGY